jgi:hypothetical protein
MCTWCVVCACLYYQQVCAAEWGRGRVVNVWGANTRVEWGSLQKALQHYFCGTLAAPHSGTASHLLRNCQLALFFCQFRVCACVVFAAAVRALLLRAHRSLRDVVCVHHKSVLYVFIGKMARHYCLQCRLTLRL